jgi:hypothetical protein
MDMAANTSRIKVRTRRIRSKGSSNKDNHSKGNHSKGNISKGSSNKGSSNKCDQGMKRVVGIRLVTMVMEVPTELAGSIGGNSE